MVGWQAGRVGIISVGQDVVSYNVDSTAHKNVINAAVAGGVQVVIVEGRFGGVALLSLQVRVGQGFSYNFIAVAGLVHVEVAGEDDVVVAAHFLDFAEDQFGTFQPGDLAQMVHVQVKEPKTPAILLLKPSPGADARQSCIPADVWHAVVGREPERSRVQQFILVFFIENRGELAFCLAIVTGHTDVGIFGKVGLEVFQLAGDDFLGTEQVKIVVADEVDYFRAPSIPTVAVGIVGSIFASDVVSGHSQVLAKNERIDA